MLDSLHAIGNALSPKANSAVFKMVEHDRMGGSVPVWEKATNAKQETALKFESVLNDTPLKDSSPFRLALTPEAPAATQTMDNNTDPEDGKPFGFGDLLDMINPLHHIPILGTLYREITGDTIRPPGKVIGGAIFGGALGAASSMVNMIIEHDTGRDVTTHAMDAVRGRKKPHSLQNDEAPIVINAPTSTPTPNPHTLAQAILAYDTSQNVKTPENTYNNFE